MAKIMDASIFDQYEVPQAKIQVVDLSLGIPTQIPTVEEFESIQSLSSSQADAVVSSLGGSAVATLFIGLGLS